MAGGVAYHHPVGGVGCRGHAQYPTFAPGSSEMAVGFFGLFVGKIPWRRERLPTPVFWPGEFHGLYSPWGHKESDTAE